MYIDSIVDLSMSRTPTLLLRYCWPICKSVLVSFVGVQPPIPLLLSLSSKLLNRFLTTKTLVSDSYTHINREQSTRLNSAANASLHVFKRLSRITSSMKSNESH